MKDYQKALNELTHCSGNSDGSEEKIYGMSVFTASNNLQELVDKETPIEPSIEVVNPETHSCWRPLLDYRCPICGYHLWGPDNISEYCPRCGQHLIRKK